MMQNKIRFLAIFALFVIFRQTAAGQWSTNPPGFISADNYLESLSDNLIYKPSGSYYDKSQYSITSSFDENDDWDTGLGIGEEPAVPAGDSFISLFLFATVYALRLLLKKRRKE